MNKARLLPSKKGFNFVLDILVLSSHKQSVTLIFRQEVQALLLGGECASCFDVEVLLNKLTLLLGEPLLLGGLLGRRGWIKIILIVDSVQGKDHLCTIFLARLLTPSQFLSFLASPQDCQDHSHHVE